jgi:hypothetical protein
MRRLLGTALYNRFHIACSSISNKVTKMQMPLLCAYGTLKMFARITRKTALSFLIVSASFNDSSAQAGQAGCEALRAKVKAHHAGYSAALSNIQSCDPAFAADALVEEWKTLPTDTASLRQLSAVTRRYNDERLLSEISTAAGDKALKRGQRLAAFQTLVAFYDPKIIVEFRVTNEIGHYGGRYVSMGRLDHPVREQGRNPLARSAQQQVVATFRRIGNEDDDPVIKAIAAYLARQLVAN